MSNTGSKTKHKVATLKPLSAAIKGDAVALEMNDNVATNNQKNFAEIDELYRQCLVLISTCTEPKQLIADRSKDARIKDMPTLTKNANILLSDLKRFTAELENIKRERDAIPKKIDNSWDNFVFIEITEKLMQWTARFQSVVVPTVTAIMLAYEDLLPEDKPSES